jgi:serine/threonine-protein kinase
MAIPQTPDLSPPLTPLPSGLRLGDVIGGRYRLDGVLGAGGMGVVVGAFHLQLDQRIAIKFMAPMLMGDSEGLRRFVLEAKNAARIRCEHVVRVFDVASLDDGSPYIVMEHLEGEDLRAVLSRRGPLPVAEVVDWVLQAGEAVAESHLAGIVHRDLKPGNLFLAARADGSPLVKVLDFGVSKLLSRTPLRAGRGGSTDPHAVVGSPLYSAPEQLRSPAKVDARADIWALGAILYELLSGKTPFTGDSYLEICTNVVRAEPTPLRSARPDVPSGLEAVVTRALSKAPAARYQTIGELAAALSPFAPRRALVSVERIENLFRGGPKSSSPGAGPPSRQKEKQHEEQHERTLPSQPDPRTARSRGRRRWQWRARTTIALVACASAAVSASTALWILGRWLRASSPRVTEQAVLPPGAPPSLAASSSVAFAPASASASAASPDEAAPERTAEPVTPRAASPVRRGPPPPRPSSLSSSSSSSSAPMSPSSPPSSTSASLSSSSSPSSSSLSRPAPSAGRVRDTSGFGGLQ